MADVQLSEKLLAGLAGWEVVKQARNIVAENRVLSSSWEPPLLRGVVQSGSTSYRAGLAIRRENDAENLCTCRESREWGTLCPHSIAVGIHFLKPAPATPPPGPHPSTPANSKAAPTSTRPVPARDVVRLNRATHAEAGEAVRIHVVLPPTLAESLARGRATIFFEGDWRRGRVPLASLPKDQTWAFAPEDLRLLEAAEAIALGDTPSMLQVTAADFATLAPTLAGHPRVTFGKTQKVTVTTEPWRIPLRATLETNGEITLATRAMPRPPVLLPGPPPWVITGTDIRPLGLPTECYPVLGTPMRWPRPKVPGFLASTLPRLLETTDLEATFTTADFRLEPEPPKFLLHLAGGLASLTAHLQCAYGPRILTIGVASPDEAAWLPDPQDPRRYSTRDLTAERAALQRLQRHGFGTPDAQGRCQLQGQNQVLSFFAREYSRLEREWRVTLEERLERSTRQNLERIEPNFTITSSGEQWFDLQVQFGTGGERLPATEIQRLLRGGQNFTRLKNGRFALLDTGAVEELEEILVDCAPQQHAGGYRLNQAQAGFLDATLRQNGWQPVAPTAWKEHARQQSGDVALACPPLGPLENILRPYQKQGVAWMHFLRQSGFGGILADEMGLGKTLQTLALLAANRVAGSPAQRRPNLVICPTSVVPNWLAEAARFAPQLRTLALEGPDRASRFARIAESDLVVTSYALVRRDFERYRGLDFDTVILDEAQHIKNRQTQNAAAVKALRSRHRLVLTGTPLENSVLDLWSIFDFLMPGYLGSATDFRDRYELPVVRERNTAVQARLARRLRPFLLRRLKREVAPELPPRIDQVVWCELTEEQAAVYQQILDATRREVLGTPGGPKPTTQQGRMLVLAALLRLRQACCDLRLMGLDDTPPADSDPAPTLPTPGAGETPARSATAPSGKVEAFAELLEESIDGGHRVLVFSQFTQMLGLLKERLAAEDIAYCYLDGSTRDRAGVVARFQNSPEIPVFLISLKAGGVGLNLTGADTVVHFDPWWNPAVEDQATDRAHRIGQSRVVTSYKLITRGTVEEKILKLQDRKRELTRGIVAGEESFTESLTWDEIQELLE